MGADLGRRALCRAILTTGRGVRRVEADGRLRVEDESGCWGMTVSPVHGH